MECPVCYTNNATCKIVCGHTFCSECVKEWYMKCHHDHQDCPMCRGPLYFKGMEKFRDRWQEEKIENMYQRVFDATFDSIIESCSDGDPMGICMAILEQMQDKYNILTNDPEGWYDEEELAFLLNDVFMDVYEPKKQFVPRDVHPYEKNLFISKQAIRIPNNTKGVTRVSGVETPIFEIIQILLILPY